jgi:hypothetical protein
MDEVIRKLSVDLASSGDDLKPNTGTFAHPEQRMKNSKKVKYANQVICGKP